MTKNKRFQEVKAGILRGSLILFKISVLRDPLHPSDWRYFPHLVLAGSIKERMDEDLIQEKVQIQRVQENILTYFHRKV